MYGLGLGDLAQTPEGLLNPVQIKFLATDGRVERTTPRVVLILCRLLPNYIIHTEHHR